LFVIKLAQPTASRLSLRSPPGVTSSTTLPSP